LALALSGPATSFAAAAEFAVDRIKDAEGVIITLAGDVEKGDAEKFRNPASPTPWSATT